MARSSTTDVLEKFRYIVSFSATGSDDPTDMGRAGFYTVQMPKSTTTKIQYREGNDPDIYSLSAGLTTMEDITLEQGLLIASAQSASPGNARLSPMYKWMSAVQGKTAGIDGYDGASGKRAGVAGTTQVAGTPVAGPNSGEKYRKTITISVLDRTGKVARKYELYNAFPVAFAPGSDLAAGEDGDKMLQSITLGYEDFKEIAV